MHQDVMRLRRASNISDASGRYHLSDVPSPVGTQGIQETPCSGQVCTVCWLVGLAVALGQVGVVLVGLQVAANASLDAVHGQPRRF
jgi:hypothetical protein